MADDNKSLFDDLILFDGPVLKDEIVVNDPPEKPEDPKPETQNASILDALAEPDPEDGKAPDPIQTSTPEEIQDEDEDEDNTETPEQEDEVEDPRAAAIYEFLTANEIIDAVEDFKGSPQQLQEILESLPQTAFIQAVEGVHPDAQELFQYGFELGDRADINALATFFAKYVMPKMDIPEITDESVAYEFLQEKFQGHEAFPTKEKLTKYLDDLLDDKTIIDTAKKVAEREKLRLDEEKKAEMEQIKLQNQQIEQQRQQFYSQVYDEVEKTNWSKNLKDQVLQNLHPNEAARKNELIRKSPKALIQLAAFYSSFDEKTGSFNQDLYAQQVVSSKNTRQKQELQKGSINSVLSKIKTGGSSAKNNKSGKDFWSDFRKG